MIKKEDSQKDHSLSTTGNIASTIAFVPPVLSLYTSLKSFSHLPHSSAQPVSAPKSNTPHGRPEAIIHDSWPDSNPGRYTSLPAFSLLLAGQDERFYGPFIAQAAAFLDLCCYPLEFQLTMHEEIVRLQ